MTVRLAAACLTLLAALPPAWAGDATPEAAALRLAADTADEQLVAQRTVLWQQLDAAQKAEFARRERAWLGSGRDVAVRACAGATGDELALQQCRLQVIEAHRSSLAAPIVQASAAR